jgi:hypothetical protein
MMRCALVLSFAISATAIAQEDAGEKGNLNLGGKQSAGGDYKGVAPGTPGLPPRPPRMPVTGGPHRMTWPGFQVRNGTPTVFLELTAMPTYHVDDGPGLVTVTLDNTIIPLRNNRRALDVTAFSTSVEKVVTQERRKKVRITIKTRGTSRPLHRERVEDAAGGFRLLVIEIPEKAE